MPAPYTSPPPPVFIASSGTPETIEYAAEKGFIPAYFTSIEKAAPMGRLYVDAASKAGNSFALGQNQAIVRWIEIGENEEEALACLSKYDVDIFKNFYAAMGRRSLTNPDDVVQSIVDSGLYSFGTVDQVGEQLLAQWNQLPAEYIILIFHFAQMPKERVIYNLERFMTHIKPELDKLTKYD